MTFFDRVSSALTGKKPPASTDLRRLVEAAREEVRMAELRLPDLKARRAEVIATGGEAGRIELRAAIATAEADADDAREALTLLEARLAEKVTADEQGRRLRQFEAAQRLRDEAAKRVVEEYPRLAAGLVALTEAVARADAAVAEANSQLPSGFSELLSTEWTARLGGDRPARIVGDEFVDLWVRDGSTEPAGEELQRRIEDVGGGKGVIRERTVVAMPPDPQRGTNGGRVTEVRVLHFERRTFRRIETVSGAPGEMPARLHEIDLPPLVGGTAPIWTKMEPWSDPDAILRQIAELEAERRQNTPQPEPRRVVKFELVAEEPACEKDHAA